MIPLQFGLGETVFLVGFGAVILLTLAFFGGVVYLDHRKEMALIEAGVYDETRTDSRAWILGGGLVLLALGLANVTTTLLAGGVPQEGVAAAFLGLAALAYYFYKRRTEARTASDGPAQS
jgi:hypothetical protein